MKKAVCVHFINKPLKSVLMAEQQFKIVGIKGYGGVIEEGENPPDTAKREIFEESGGIKEKRLNPYEEGGIIFDTEDLIPVAVIDFYNGTEEEVSFGDPSFRVMFYNCYKFNGRAIDTLEMRNPWMYPFESLKYEKIIHGDEYYLFDILEGKMRTGWIRRTKDFKTILDHQIEPCELKDLVI